MKLTKKLIVFLLITFLAVAQGVKAGKALASSESIDKLNDNYPNVSEEFTALYAPYDETEKAYADAILKISQNNPEVESLPPREIRYLVSGMQDSGIWFFQFSKKGPTHTESLNIFTNQIIPFANDKIGNTTEPAKQVLKFFSWIKDEFEYGRSCDRENNLAWLWDNRKAVCEGYAVVMVALLKAVGIPARKVHDSGINHAWVEAYVDGRWVAVVSTGYLDTDENAIITRQELETQNQLENMYNVFTESPKESRYDITYGYNDLFLEDFLSRVDSLVDSSGGVTDELNQASDLLDEWREENSIESSVKTGKKVIEHALNALGYSSSGAGTEVSVRELANYDEDGGFEVDASTNLLYILDPFQEEGCGGSLRALLGDKGDLSEYAIDALRWAADQEDFTVKLILAGGKPFRFKRFSAQQIESLVTFYDSTRTELSNKMEEFVDLLLKLEKNEVSEANFTLPVMDSFDYSIEASGPFMYNEKGDHIGYSLVFDLHATITVEDLTFERLLMNHEYLDFKDYPKRPNFANIVFEYLNGQTYSPVEKNDLTVYETCPSEFVNLLEGTTLKLSTTGEPTRIEKEEYILWTQDPVKIAEEVLISDFNVSRLNEDGDLRIAWTNPSEDRISEIVVRRKIGNYSEDHKDGEEVYRESSPVPGKAISFTGTELDGKSAYHYSLFTKGKNGNWNDSVLVGSNADKLGLPTAPGASDKPNDGLNHPRVKQNGLYEDVDGNGKFEIDDAILLARLYADLEEGGKDYLNQYGKYFDFDKDGDADIDDAITLARIYAGLEPGPASLNAVKKAKLAVPKTYSQAGTPEGKRVKLVLKNKPKQGLKYYDLKIKLSEELSDAEIVGTKSEALSAIGTEIAKDKKSARMVGLNLAGTNKGEEPLTLAYLWVNGADASDLTVQVNELVSVEDNPIPNTELSFTTPEINTLKLDKVSAYPNPTYSGLVRFSVQGEGIASSKLEVYTPKGEKIYDSGYHMGRTLTWNQANDKGKPVPNGLYLYQVKVKGINGDLQTTETRKLLVLS